TTWTGRGACAAGPRPARAGRPAPRARGPGLALPSARGASTRRRRPGPCRRSRSWTDARVGLLAGKKGVTTETQRKKKSGAGVGGAVARALVAGPVFFLLSFLCACVSVVCVPSLIAAGRRAGAGGADRVDHQRRLRGAALHGPVVDDPAA